MARWVTPLLLGAVVGATGCLSDSGTVDNEIVGGRDANIEEVPWQISLQGSYGHFCGGSILTPEWVLTAQHCVVWTSAASMKVVAGFSAQSAKDEGQTVAVAEVIRYPGYTTTSDGKDVALLRLAEPLDLSGPKAQAIRYATAADANAGLTDPGVMSTVSGWGTLSSGGSSPDQLQLVEVPLVSNADAAAAYGDDKITDDQLAAGVMGVGGVDACQGDSGGPLVVPNADGSGYVLAGVVSWGYGCAEADYPGLYARVSAFEDWLVEHVGAQDPEDPEDPEDTAGLLINEILADAYGVDANGDGVLSSSQDEFIELVNTGDAALDLSGAIIADSYAQRVVLPEGTVLEAGAALVVFGGGEPAIDTDAQVLTGRLYLNNNGDSVMVISEGQVLAEASYGREGGHEQSLVREVEGTDSAFALHGDVADSPASPGTRADGSPL